MTHWPRVRSAAAAALVSVSPIAFAHAPILDCFIEQGSVTCEAGFSDGSPTTGRKIQVRDPRGKVLLEGVFDKDNRHVFTPPAKDYSVIFLGGDGHDVTIHSSDIPK